ncbi:hypothetical protein LCGC14_0716100 [marine sediment metagenome]|uniref:Uncharacterized protein n=1 Tax=marine sediment metagenome TaxID=412755 RepID=A0A0F9SZ80_9ZZZZ
MRDELTPESEGMVREDIPKSISVTGSTGINSLQDGAFRASIVALPAGILAFVHIEYSFLSNDGFAYAAIALAPVGILLWAVFDKFVKPRLVSS